MRHDEIIITKASEHNLKSIDVKIPKRKLVVITGLSGSGKSSLAFDTLHAEGKRLYLESMSSYLRYFESNNKPNVESISGLSPSIAIDQKSFFKNPRSTVGTVTEIYDYLRLLFAKIGVPHSPVTNLPILRQSPEEISKKIMEYSVGKGAAKIMAQVIQDEKGDHRKTLVSIRKNGFHNLKVNNEFHNFDTLPVLNKDIAYTIYIVIDKVYINRIGYNDVLELVKSAIEVSNGTVCVEYEKLQEMDPIIKAANSNDKASVQDGGSEDVILFSEKFKCNVSGFTIPELTTKMFSFNSPYGACNTCGGLGVESFFSPEMIIPDSTLSINDGAILPWSSDKNKSKSVDFVQYKKILESLSKRYNFSLDVPFVVLAQEIQDIILYGEKNVDTKNDKKDDEKTPEEGESSTEKNKVKVPARTYFEGVIPILEKQSKASIDSYSSNNNADGLNSYRDVRKCSECDGYRVNKGGLCVKVEGLHIGNVCSMDIKTCLTWFNGLLSHLNQKDSIISEKIVVEIVKRLENLEKIGLGYVTLDRRFSTLSGGESQRLRLVMQIGYSLTEVIYVLDEPSIGLHQADSVKLLEVLFNLRDLGNTVVIVEHDEETIRAADFIIDMGKGAGIYGGEVMASGSLDEVMQNKDSITAQYLSGLLSIPVPQNRRSTDQYITVFGAREHNLKNITVTIPLKNFVAISGVSGSGKSTFVMDILYKSSKKCFINTKLENLKYDKITGLEYVDQVIAMDQSSIGRTPRSNPATYTNAFLCIREHFASLPESKSRGYNSTRFSFNMKGGRCESCEGDGMIKIEMQLLPDVYVECEECCGKRYNQDTIQVKYKGKSIADVLDMTIDEAVDVFKDIQDIHEKLVTLQEVGLGYIKMGQSATTLSGGEAQRIKLTRELSKKCHGNTLYILDEPTTGLHMDDVKKLLHVLHKLVDYGNSVIVIEHNLDVIKTADHVIDFGPGSGNEGGMVIMSGTPEEIAQVDESTTGRCLRKYLSKI